MPNHCDNRLTVTGEPSDLKRFVEYAKGEEQPLDYDKLCPMPENKLEQLAESKDCFLNDMRTFMDGTPIEQLEKAQEEGDERKASHILQEAWYDWRLHHWNTKWNCYDGSVDISQIDQGKVVYYFQSAWSPPTGVFRAAGERFQTLKFVLEYAEPGCDFSGVMEVIGDAVDEESYDDVLATEFGQELYQEMHDEMEQEDAEDQDDCNT